MLLRDGSLNVIEGVVCINIVGFIQVAEVKFLIDAIQSSKFITEKKSNELIKKVKGWWRVFGSF